VEEAVALGRSLAVIQEGKSFLCAFFTVHYGIFCLVRGVTEFVLLGTEGQLEEEVDCRSLPELCCYGPGDVHFTVPGLQFCGFPWFTGVAQILWW